MLESVWYVPMAHFAASKERPLSTSGVGSCVVVVFYDPIARVGGLAHPMLPDERYEDGETKYQPVDADLIVGSSKTVTKAVDVLIQSIESLGGKRSRFIAKVVGGAHMFRLFDSPKEGVGTQNIQAVKTKCLKEQIPIVAEDTGGTVGRIVEFDIRNGFLNVTTKI